MVLHYKTFTVNGSSRISNCQVNAGVEVGCHAAIEQNDTVWKHAVSAKMLVMKKVAGTWRGNGAFEWKGSCALKPNVIYDLEAEGGFFPGEGEYMIGTPMFTFFPQESGVYYCNGLELTYRQ